MGNGLQGGAPLVLFDGGVSNALTISPYSNFMSGSQYIDASGQLNCGVMGGVTSIPAGFDFETIVYYGGGVNAAMRGWGAALRARSGKTPASRDADHSINYLGYWTDNGAYYYYLTEEGKSYDQTLVDVRSYADERSIPYRYFQLDSWWCVCPPSPPMLSATRATRACWLCLYCSSRVARAGNLM